MYKRHADWGKLEIWQGLLKHLTELDSDLEYVRVDSTVVRAYALMDKAYDSNAILEVIEATEAVAVVPAKSNRKTPRKHDEHMYKKRHKIQCTFG